MDTFFWEFKNTKSLTYRYQKLIAHIWVIKTIQKHHSLTHENKKLKKKHVP